MAGAIFSLPPHYETAFDDNWREIMAQQTDHRLAGMYMSDNVNGNQKRYDQIGDQSYAMRQITARAQKSEPSDIPTFSVGYVLVLMTRRHGSTTLIISSLVSFLTHKAQQLNNTLLRLTVKKTSLLSMLS